ncbi:unnamed protein product [Heligmosomoides polygyrus]|uniref:MFS_1_like domain-containing protein n=1 Tax=Heligmosomoides polygyrus TaxID=6339 RepID=A0A183G3F5_HELPZ|nr:unnamed protein product [Heligmosomoides polygyrus]
MSLAGMTSEGGGAVAFPFMTLCLHIDPVTARDFSLMIQSFGKIYCGMVDDFLGAPQKKMLFVSIWSSFAIALFILNAQKKRKTYTIIPDFKPWKALVLVLTGFIGGQFVQFFLHISYPLV